MVGVLVDHDLIASPVPARDDVVIVRRDVPVEIVKPEAFPVSSRKVEYMLRSKATGEASVYPRLIEVVMRIVGPTIMSDPLIIRGVNVRNVRMTFLVHGNVVLNRGIGLLTSCRGRSARRPGSLRGSGTASGNVSTANRRGRPPPRGAPPRPFSCAKATTQIRTDSPIIFFTLTSLRYLAREISLHVLFHQAELPDLRPAKAGVAGQGADPAARPSHATSTLAR